MSLSVGPGPASRPARPALALLLALAGCAAPRLGPTPEPEVAAASAPAHPPAAEACTLSGRIAGAGATVVFVREADVAAPLPTVAWRCAEGGFAPAFLVVGVGQPIELRNDDDLCHRFFSAPGFGAFTLGLMRPGEAGTFRIDTAGTVPIYCALHGGRQATLVVVPATRFARVAPSGEFTLRGLRPGLCALEVWRETGPPLQFDVTLPAGGRAGLELAAPPASPGR